jgi:ribosome-binding factor A
MTVGQRLQRVQSLAREIMSDLVRGLKDPRIGFATVTAVRVSADLRHARVFVSVMGDEEARRRTMSGLDSAKPFLRAELGRQLRTKYSPELAFELDLGADTVERVEELLEQARRTPAQEDTS